MKPQPPGEETIFNAALELGTPEERAAYLKEACAGNEALRQRLETRLRAAADAPPQEAGAKAVPPASDIAPPELHSESA